VTKFARLAKIQWLGTLFWDALSVGFPPIHCHAPVDWPYVGRAGARPGDFLPKMDRTPERKGLPESSGTSRDLYRELRERGAPSKE